MLLDGQHGVRTVRPLDGPERGFGKRDHLGGRDAHRHVDEHRVGTPHGLHHRSLVGEIHDDGRDARAGHRPGFFRRAHQGAHPVPPVDQGLDHILPLRTGGPEYRNFG